MIDQVSSRRLPQFDRKYIRRQEWVEKLQQHGLHCHYCKTSLIFPDAVKEHLTPLCRGGADHIDNIVPACALCNQMKAWRTEEEFLRDREMLLQRYTGRCAIAKPKPSKFSLEEANEPGLLKKLTFEREQRSAWWRSA